MTKRNVKYFLIGFVAALTFHYVGTAFSQQYPQGTVIYPTIPGTNFKDYNLPGYVLKGNTWHQTIPGTRFRSYEGPSYRIQPPAYNVQPYSVPHYYVPPIRR